MAGPDQPITPAGGPEYADSLGCKETFLFVECGDISMGKASASCKHEDFSADPSTQTPAGHGGPHAISAMGRNKQEPVSQIRQLHMYFCTAIHHGQPDGGKHLSPTTSLQVHVHIGACKYIYSSTKRERAKCSGFMPAISATVRKWRQEDQEFKVSLSYKAKMRTAKQHESLWQTKTKRGKGQSELIESTQWGTWYQNQGNQKQKKSWSSAKCWPQSSLLSKSRHACNPVCSGPSGRG